MNRKILITLLAGILMTATATAQLTAPPETNTTIAQTNNTSAEVVSNSFPFSATNQDGDITVNPSTELTPRTYSGEIRLTSNESFEVDVEIPAVSNWTLTTGSLNHTLSTGTSGDITNLTAELEGNTEARITAEITGNLSEYYSTDPVFTLYPNIERQITLGYQIPSDTDFGEYNGHLILKDDQGNNETVNLTAYFEDNEQPEIQNTVFDDVQATQDVEQFVTASDNLEISDVSVEVLREIEIDQGNETIVVNRTVDEYSFEHRENTDTWKHTFKDTEEIGQHYARIKVWDTANNTVNTTESFQVDGLDATQVLDSNFEFQLIPHNDEISREIIHNEIKSPFNLTLNQFTYGGNSTVKVGVVPPDADSAEFFEETGEVKEFSKKGTYEVVVRSYEEEPAQNLYTYDASLELSVPEQHYPVDNIVFTGNIDSYGYPSESVIYEGEGAFEGYIAYGFDSAVEGFEENHGDLDEGSAVDYAVKISRMPVDACRGSGEWGDCGTLTMGEYQRTVEENDILWFGIKIAVAFGLIVPVGSITYLLLFMRRKLGEGRIVAGKPVKPQHFNKNFTDQELREYGVIE